MSVKYVYRTEQTIVKKSNPLYKKLDDLAFKAKNLYNASLYEQRQVYFERKQFISYFNLYTIMKDEDCFKELPNNLSKPILKQVATNCSSFVKASKAYAKKPEAFKAKPKLPGYKHKTNGRFTVTFTAHDCRIKEGKVHFHKIMDGFTLKTKFTELKQVQIVPRLNTYVINVTGSVAINIQDNPNAKYAVGIDLGVDNFATVSVWNETSKPLIINGKGLKSYNKYFNKQLAHMKSEAKLKNGLYFTKRIRQLYQKRNNYMHNFMHQASKRIVDYLVENNVKYLVIGINKDWKQNSKLSKNVNQTFIQIPCDKFISMLTYKAQDKGIKVYHTEEAYTSGTSFLDNEQPTKEFYNKSRRVHRGLFVSSKGIHINADVNASYQIMKKVFKDLVFSDTISTKKIYNKTIPNRVNVA